MLEGGGVTAGSELSDGMRCGMLCRHIAAIFPRMAGRVRVMH